MVQDGVDDNPTQVGLFYGIGSGACINKFPNFIIVITSGRERRQTWHNERGATPASRTGDSALYNEKEKFGIVIKTIITLTLTI